MTKEEIESKFREAMHICQLTTKEIDFLINTKKKAFTDGMKFALKYPEMAAIMIRPEVGLDEDISKVVDGKQ